MKFARYTFLGAAVWGLLVLLPQFFLESRVAAETPPAITHPEFYYGFLGVATAFQLVFLVVAFDPSAFRVLIPIAIVEKLGFAVPAIILYLSGRMAAGGFFIGAITDLLLAALFTVSMVKVARST
ncbi:MAG: hypothetical protein UZ17_ACD001001739 [Acidobacteria bacterium OLB17]|nr:MAG: hypothetical protein UZ17_ACD001001739 [Acidobacteria bacterium OLB17]MCZ2390675.1 hypothetical protein [Acidobacteriota bacterium]